MATVLVLLSHHYGSEAAERPNTATILYFGSPMENDPNPVIIFNTAPKSTHEKSKLGIDHAGLRPGQRLEVEGGHLAGPAHHEPGTDLGVWTIR